MDSLLGRPIEVGGPLDGAAHWALDPRDPNAGFAPFAVEVKNIRGMVYPWSTEAWDLLAKLGAFPDVIPVLAARRIHATTFRFFRDIGALGTELRNQLFSATIDRSEFSKVRGGLGLLTTAQVDQEWTSAPLTKFFRTTGPALASEQLARWRRAAPIVKHYASLREEHDSELWSEFCSEIIGEGLYERGGWAPASSFGETEPDADWVDDDW